MKKLKTFLEALGETITITKREGLLIVAVSALAGIVLGIFCSPKKRTMIGSNNGNNSSNSEHWNEELCNDEDWVEDESEKDCFSFN